MPTIEPLPTVSLPERMFLGSLDDSVTRYPWQGVSVDLEALNRSLIFHALLGPKVCCRIGNLVYNDNFLPALLSPASSPLLLLCEQGFFQIQMRAKGINASIEERLSIRTNSAIRFQGEHGYINGGKIYRTFQEIEERLSGTAGLLHYSPNFVAAFKVLCGAMVPHANTPFETVFNAWQAEFDEGSRSRSNFEILAERLLSSFQDRLQAMRVINSINHYAYGLALRDEIPGAAIETKEIRDLQPLTSTMFGQEERTMEAELFREVYKSEAVKVVQENLLIPARLFRDPALWAKLALLLNAQNGERSKEFLAHKTHFLEATSAIIGGDASERARSSLERTSRSYSRVINSLLGTNAAKQLRVQIDFYGRRATGHGVGIALDKVGDYLVPGAGSILKLAIEVVVKVYGQIAENSAIRGLDQFLTPAEPAAEVLGPDVHGPFEGLVVRRMDIGASTLLVKPTSVSQHQS